MKTNYFLSLSFVFLVLTSFSITKNSISKTKETEFVIEKDTFNIMASHGIYLREDANLTSNKLAKLPYSTKLIFLNQDTISEEITIQETKYFEIKGRMQKVKVISPIDSLNNLEGYVFDGYLTKFPVPILNYKVTEKDNDTSRELNYLESNFEEYEKYDIKKGTNCKDCISKWKRKYGKNIIYGYDETGADTPKYKIEISNFSIREAYFFSLVLFFSENNEYNEGDKLIFDKNNNSFKIEPLLGGGCYYSIFKNDTNKIVIEWLCWAC